MSEESSTDTQKSTAAQTFYWHLAPLRIVFRAISSIAPRLTGRLVLGLFRTPRRHRTPPRELEWLESGETFAIDAGGEQLAGWSWGSGPTVLLMHGWEGRASQIDSGRCMGLLPTHWVQPQAPGRQSQGVRFLEWFL